MVWIPVGLLLGFVTLMIGANLLAVRRARAMQGQPSPLATPTDGASLFYFMSPSCGACRSMTPVVREMATENDQVHVVDVTQRPELAQKFSVMATPTTVLVRDGLVQQVIVGARTPAAMRALVAS